MAALVVGVGAIVLWGAASTALPPAGFQVGIMAGSLTGGLLYQHAGPALMIAVSTALVMVALTCVTATRGLFEVPQPTSRK